MLHLYIFYIYLISHTFGLNLVNTIRALIKILLYLCSCCSSSSACVCVCVCVCACMCVYTSGLYKPVLKDIKSLY